MKAGDVVAETIEKQLAYVRERRGNVEARGQMVISTSGALVTLQLAFVTLVAPGEAVGSPLARVFLGLSLTGFLVASVFGILPNRPRSWPEMKPESLRVLLDDAHWDAPEEKARKRVASAQLAILTESMTIVQTMSRQLTAAIVSEVAAMAMLAVAVLAIIVER